MAKYEEASVKLTNTHLNKFKSAAKNNTGTTLKITQKKIQDDELFHELLLAAMQKTKIRNVFANDMSTNIKLSKSQLAKVIQSSRLGKRLGKVI